jgi:hypothetical protein
MSSLQKVLSRAMSPRGDDKGTFFVLIRMDTLTHALSGALLRRAAAPQDALAPPSS